MKLLGAALGVAGVALAPMTGTAQTTLGAVLGLYSSYVWRGITYTNKPVAQPDVYLTVPAGNASLTFGGWANVDLGRYDDAEDDLSLGGGLSGLDLSEFDPYAEVSLPAGKATLTGGLVGYLFPNDLTDESNGGLDSESNTWEVYGKVGFDVPLAPELSVYYDFDKIKGAYFEGAVSHDVPLNETLALSLGAAAGLNAGQGIPEDPTSDESFNFEDDGFTALELSASLPVTAGIFSIAPELHLVINGDGITKFTSPTNESDVKVWAGVSISWERAFGEAPEEE